MPDAKVRVTINGTEYTANLKRVKTSDKLNQVTTFEATLEGTANTTDIAPGNSVNFYYGTSAIDANIFFRGNIKVLEEQTAKQIKISGYGTGWHQLADRKHARRAEYGTASRKIVYNPISNTNSAVTTTTRIGIVTYLASEGLDGSGSTLIATGTVDSPGSDITFFASEMEYRHLPFFRLSDLFDTDVFVSYPAGVATINLTTRGSDKTGTHIFNLSGASKNAKVASYVLDRENQFTQVTVIGAGTGRTQVAGQYPSGSYSPDPPKKELIVNRPDLKSSAECSLAAQSIHGIVSQLRKRLRVAPDVPSLWLANTIPGDTIQIANSNLANLSTATPFNTRIQEITFEMDYEAGKFELVFQTENRASTPFDGISSSQYSSDQLGGSSQSDGRGLNMLRDANSSERTKANGFLTQGGLLGKMAWFSLSGDTDATSYIDEVYYPLRLDNRGALKGHILFRGLSADPTIEVGIGPTEGAFYYNSTTKKFRFFNGSAWADVGSASSSLEWTRTTGTPNFLAPTNANDHVRPNGTADLGATTARWANIFGVNGSYTGTVTANQLTTTLSAIIGTDLTVNGDATLGDSSADDIAINGRITTHLISNTSLLDLGQNASPTWRDLWLGRNASILGSLTVGGTTTLGDASGDTITLNGRIGSSLIPSTVGLNIGQLASPTWQNLFLNGSATLLGGIDVATDAIFRNNVTLGDAAGDTITTNGRFASSLIPSDNIRNIGQAASPTWNNIFIGGSLDAGGDITCDGNIIADGNVILGSSSTDSVTVNGRFASHLIPIDNVRNIGQLASPTWNNLTISGTLTKGSGSFVIDHPGDPANKYLRHSFVESPEMVNLYKGEGKLQNGKCTIFLPEYFKKLNGSPFQNRDMTFQLTSIAGPQNLWGEWAEEGNLILLKVSGQKLDGTPAHGMFYWLVTAVRHDPFAEKNPIIVEEVKSPEKKGTYIHPELYVKEESA